MRDNFDRWLDNLVKNQKLDVLDTYKITKNDQIYEITLKQILDCLKLLNIEEKIQIRKTLENIIKEEESIKDCLICFGKACIKTIEEVELEEDETM